MYLIFRAFVNTFKVLPFWAVYAISEVLFIFISIVGYRKRVVFDNLRRSFPEKTDRDIREIKRKAYRHFCDMLVEEMKSHSMTVDETEKRYRLVDTSLLDKYYEQGRTVICLVGHYGNWEWATIGLKGQIKQKLAGFYKPFKNMNIDKDIRKQRHQCGMELCPIDRTPYLFRDFKNKNGVIFMIADQSNPNYKKRIWVNFLNQETDCLQGPEYYAKMFDMPVVYAEVIPIKRGYYECFVTSITDDPKKTADGYITKRYFEELECTIKKAPQYWMWTHKRWKHKRHETELNKPIY